MPGRATWRASGDSLHASVQPTVAGRVRMRHRGSLFEAPGATAWAVTVYKSLCGRECLHLISPNAPGGEHHCVRRRTMAFGFVLGRRVLSRHTCHRERPFPGSVRPHDKRKAARRGVGQSTSTSPAHGAGGSPAGERGRGLVERKGAGATGITPRETSRRAQRALPVFCQRS